MSKQHERDLAIIEHAINVSNYHGGSFNLKDAFRHIKNFLSGTKKKKKEQNIPEKENFTYEEFPKPKPKPKPKTEYTFDDDENYGQRQQKPKPQPRQQQPTQPARHPDEHHYATLGLTSDATPAEVNKAYRKLALKYHPDKNVGNEVYAAKEFQNINNAYTALTGRGFKKRKYNCKK
jgi:hypothetical protein